MAKKKTQSEAVWKNLLAGGAAGAFEASVMFPTEFVKTQLQLDAASAKAGGEARYTGVLDCAKKTVQTKGVIGLYSGLSTVVTGSIPKAAVRFAAFNQFKSMLKDDQGKLTPLRTMLSGLGAGISEAILAVTPMETVKTKLIHDQNSAKPRYTGMIHGVSTMVKEEGIGAIYKGVVPTMAKQGCNQATRFTIYNGITGYLKGEEEKALHPTVVLACGSFAGFVSVYATMPFDVVKTQMQGLEASKYTGAVNCGMTVAKEGGITALWKGTTPRLGRVMCSSAIIFAAYEQVMAGILYAVPDTK